MLNLLLACRVIKVFKVLIVFKAFPRNSLSCNKNRIIIIFFYNEYKQMITFALRHSLTRNMFVNYAGIFWVEKIGLRVIPFNL